MRPFAPVILAALLLAGCTGTSDDSSVADKTPSQTATSDAAAQENSENSADTEDAKDPSVTTDACTWLSADDLSTVFTDAGYDVTFDSGTSTDIGDGSACTWITGTYGTLSLTSNDLERSASEEVTLAGHVFSNSKEVAIPGADAAWVSEDGTTLQAAAGNHVITIVLMLMNDDAGTDPVSAITAVAALAIAAQ